MTFWEALPIILWFGPFLLIVLYAAWVHFDEKYDPALVEDNEVARLEAIPTLNSDPHPWL